MRAVPLDVAGAFHSPIMAPAAEGLGSVLDETPMQAANCPVIANVDAEPHGDATSMRDKLTRQLTHPVRWQESVEKLIGQGYDCFVEIGPGRILTSFMRKIDRKMKTVNVSGLGDLDISEMVRQSA
jgi:[acyl-carrier-protein] S-malonyltransferase